MIVWIRLLVVLTCTPMLGGCFYDVGRHWVESGPPGSASSAFDDPLRPTPSTPLRPTLVSCVAKNDPAHLYQLENGGEYRMSGWFLSDKRIGAVSRCMRASGWQATPNTLLLP